MGVYLDAAALEQLDLARGYTSRGAYLRALALAQLAAASRALSPLAHLNPCALCGYAVATRPPGAPPGTGASVDRAGLCAACRALSRPTPEGPLLFDLDSATTASARVHAYARREGLRVVLLLAWTRERPGLAAVGTLGDLRDLLQRGRLPAAVDRERCLYFL